MELTRTSRHKLGNIIAEKDDIINIEKTWKTIIDNWVNKITVAECALNKTEKTAYNTIIRPWVSIFKERNKVKNVPKQDFKAKWVILPILFKKLKSRNILLVETIGW